MAAGAILAATLVGVAPASANHTQDPSVFNEHYDFAGQYLFLRPGNSIDNLLNVPASRQCIGGELGQAATIVNALGTVACGDSNWNDRISSVYVPPGSHGVVLYEHTGFQGRRLVLRPGTYNRLPGIWEVDPTGRTQLQQQTCTLARAAGLGVMGCSYLYKGSWNDRASSLYVCTRHSTYTIFGKEFWNCDGAP